jgi:hypothetical protein
MGVEWKAVKVVPSRMGMAEVLLLSTCLSLVSTSRSCSGDHIEMSRMVEKFY